MVSMQGKENKVKLGVKKMGCNGYAYFFEFTSRSNKSDHRVCVDDIDFYIPSDSVEIIKGSQVDFTIEGLNQGIKFINPNASAVCGCGESFTVRDEEFSTEATSAQKKN
jgi:iron-sulfur cluster assembly accessory protein